MEKWPLKKRNGDRDVDYRAKFACCKRTRSKTVLSTHSGKTSPLPGSSLWAYARNLIVFSGQRCVGPENLVKKSIHTFSVIRNWRQWSLSKGEKTSILNDVFAKTGSEVAAHSRFSTELHRQLVDFTLAFRLDSSSGPVLMSHRQFYRLLSLRSNNGL